MKNLVPEKYYINPDDRLWPYFNEALDFNNVGQWRRNYVRVNSSGCVPTLTANMGTGGSNWPIIKELYPMSNSEQEIIYEKRIRRLTPRECLRLMGFTDDFNIVVSDTQMYKQAGNSIVVDVLMHLFSRIDWETVLEN